jgi:hypothetical protein
MDRTTIAGEKKLECLNIFLLKKKTHQKAKNLLKIFGHTKMQVLEKNAWVPHHKVDRILCVLITIALFLGYYNFGHRNGAIPLSIVK